MAKIKIVLHNIADMNVDCLVNPANEDLIPSGGTSKAIFMAAGFEEMSRAVKEFGSCGRGSCVMTPGFGLKAKAVLHVVGPVWNGGKNGEERWLRSCYEKAMDMALRNGLFSICFPLISAGQNGFPLYRAWEIALRAAMNCKWDMDIYFAVIGRREFQAGEEVLRQLREDEEILGNLNREELWKHIEFLCSTRKIPWQGMEQLEDSSFVLGYPKYPDGVFDVFGLLKPDYDYCEHQDSWPDNLQPTDMTASQIRTELTSIERSERFCDGAIAGHIENGYLLKLLLRLDDLLKKHKNIIDYI